MTDGASGRCARRDSRQFKAPWQRLYLIPLPQWQGSFRPILCLPAALGFGAIRLGATFGVLSVTCLVTAATGPGTGSGAGWSRSFSV